MSKRYISICLFVGFAMLGAFTAKAQNHLEDVVYLKNGSVVRGLLVEQVPNKSVKLQTRDGNIFVYQVSEIEKITREQPAKAASATNESGSFAKATRFNFTPLVAWGFNDFAQLGFGFRSGVTVINTFYTGATFAYHLGSEGVSSYYFGGELGYKGDFGKVIVHPYSSLGLAAGNVGEYSESAFYVAPAFSLGFKVAEGVVISPDLKYLIIPSSSDANTFVLSLGFSLDFGR